MRKKTEKRRISLLCSLRAKEYCQRMDSTLPMTERRLSHAKLWEALVMKEIPLCTRGSEWMRTAVYVCLLMNGDVILVYLLRTIIHRD